MSKALNEIDDTLASWLTSQHVFFVATAPLSAAGHINCSPKGGDCFRVLAPRTVAYLDYTGSGAETAAHLRENGRIVIMFCAFDGNPNIIRLHGRGEVIRKGSDAFPDLALNFPENPGARAIVRIDVERVSTSCGMSIPLMDFNADRDALDNWARKKGPDGLAEYQARNNSASIDGLPALK